MSLGDKYARIIKEGTKRMEDLLKRAKERGAKTIILYFFPPDVPPEIGIRGVDFVREDITEDDIYTMRGEEWDKVLMSELEPLAEEIVEVAKRLYRAGIMAHKVIEEVAKEVGLKCIETE